MINGYLDYLAKAAPVITTRQDVISVSQIGSIVGDLLYLENGYMQDWQGKKQDNYIGILSKYAEDMKNDIPSVMFLVCENIELAKKCSVILSMYRQRRLGVYSDDDDDYSVYEYDTENGDDESADEKPDCCAVNMSIKLQPSNGMLHDYTSFTCPQSKPDCIMFYNVPDDDLPLKLQALDMCSAKFTIICIDESQCRESWVLDIKRRKNAGMVNIPVLSREHFEKLALDFLKDMGYGLENGFSVVQLVKRAEIRLGDKLSEEALCWLLELAVSRSRSDSGEQILRRTDFEELDFNENSAAEELESMIGLESVKTVVEEWCAVTSESLSNKRLGMLYKNMIFTGRSGTGKTTIARLLAKIMAETGVCNGNFSECSRSDLIGKYLGHTAPKVAAKFEAARNGVLFVDEAGFFVKDRNDSFLEEALKEFVRYMELYPDVMVIFAMYDNEVDAFLEKDIGLKSRISEIVRFDDYTLDELWRIEKKMLSDMGYSVDQGCRETFDGYMNFRMKNQDFGNARESRRLAEACVKAVCVRHMKTRKSTGRQDMKVKKCDMERAVQRLGIDGKKNDTSGHNPIGFIHNLQETG